MVQVWRLVPAVARCFLVEVGILGLAGNLLQLFFLGKSSNFEKRIVTMINWREYIESDPKVMYGKPVIMGTRIPIDLVLEKLSDGESVDELLEAYPRLSKEGIAAVLAYATDAIR